MRVSLFYRLSGLWIKLGLYIYYRKTNYTGVERYPYKNPVILAPNHQSAFMDALVVSHPLVNRTEISYMVRQDVFNNKLLAFYLRQLKLFPAYRMRDGYENLVKNKESFEHCYRLLRDNYDIIIFPEANHDIPLTLRTLKKGLMRVAFEGLVNNNVSTDLKIIPIGINYSDPFNPNSQLLINFGEPFEITHHLEKYKESPAHAINDLREELSEKMRPLQIDIRNKDYYDEIDLIREMIVNDQTAGEIILKRDFGKYKTAIDEIESYIEQNPNNDLKDLVKSYKENENQTGLHDNMLASSYKFKDTFKYLLLIILGFPLYVVGAVVNYIPFIIANNVAENKIKDVGFRSSIKFGIGLVLASLVHITIAIVSAFILPEWWMCFAVFPILYYCTKAYMRWIWVYRKLKAILKYRALTKSKDDILIQQIEIRKKILSRFNQG